MSAWDDIRDNDFSNAHGWSTLAKIVIVLIICAVIIGVGGYFIVWPKFEEIKQSQTKEESLRVKFEDKQTKAANLPYLKQQLEKMEDEYCKMLDQLPDETQMPDLLENISQSAQQAGIETELFQPGSETKKTYYAVKPIELRMRGGYHEIANFISGVAALPRIVTLTGGNLTLKPEEGESSRLILTGTAKTFRRLEGDKSICKDDDADSLAQSAGAGQ